MSADFTPEKEDYGVLSPFKMQVLTNFPYIEADFDALTDYGLLCKVVEYLNNVIANENEVTEQVTSLYNAYVALQNYVNTYFDNLDLTGEVSAKLNEMATDGTLTNLIKSYVDPIYEAYEEVINLRMDNQDGKLLEQDTEISNFKTLVNGEINTINNKVTNATSGSPKGVYSTLTALQTADPSHDYIYVVTADGNWYYYDTSLSAWTSGGTYQGTTIADKSISYNKTDFVTLGTNLFNKNTIITGYYVDRITGNILENAGSCASDYIIVDGLTHVVSNYSTQCAFYDENKTYISGYNDDNSDVPATAYYIRVTVPNSANIINKYKLNAGSSLQPYDDYQYNINYLKLKNSKIDYDNKIELESIGFVDNSINLIDYSKIVDNKYIDYNSGAETSNNNYFSTDYIPVGNATKLSFNMIDHIQTAFYNKNKGYISGDLHTANEINIPSDAYYFRTCNEKDKKNKFMAYFGDNTSKPYEPYNNYYNGNNNKIIYVGPNRTITTLKAGIEEASKYFGATVYVDKGTYNLVTEYGSEYLESTQNNKGLILCNKMHIIFDSNAYVTFNYTGSNSYINEEFSPFNAGLYGFTLENLNLVCSNCRYCIHDERGGSTDSYINKYINCKMAIDNSNNPTWHNEQNIGAGLGERGYIIVDGCHFNHSCTWHNNNNTGYLSSASKVIIKNNYWDSGFIWATDSNKTAFTNPSLFYVYNNCKTGDITTTPGNTNIIVKEWNNITHD